MTPTAPSPLTSELLEAVEAVRRAVAHFQAQFNLMARRCDELVEEPPIRRVLDAVSREFGVTPSAILGRLKTRNVAFARFAAVHLYSRLAGGTTKDVMRAFRYDDHGSIYNARLRVPELIETDAEFRGRYERCAIYLALDPSTPTTRPIPSHA